MLAPGYYFRAFNGKRNFAPPAEASDWFKIESLVLANGDNVGVVTGWRYPASQAAPTAETLNTILDETEVEMDGGRHYSGKPQATDRAAWKVVQKHCPTKTEAQCRAMIREWIKAGVLIEKKYYDPVSRKEEWGLFVDRNKRPRYQ
jgi:hypothetical protein